MAWLHLVAEEPTTCAIEEDYQFIHDLSGWHKHDIQNYAESWAYRRLLDYADRFHVHATVVKTPPRGWCRRRAGILKKEIEFKQLRLARLLRIANR